MQIHIEGFSGAAPKISAPMLPNGAGQVASNVKLTSGSLRPINAPKQAFSGIVSGAKSVYLLGTAPIPMAWSTDVDVAASPIADTEYRIYYTDGTAPKKTTLAMATAAGAPYTSSYYLMGTPKPTAAPTLASTTGSVPAGNYVYVFTYVTQFGSVLEESAPSAPATITLGATGGVTVTFPANPSFTNRNYVAKRVYRSTGTAFQQVDEVSIASATFTDNLAPTAIDGFDLLPTAYWTPPPDDLKGITALPNGTMVGFRNNEIWFSEPGYPHAWPANYMQTVDSQIVGIGSFGNNVVICTQAFPYVGGGVHPESFTFQKLPFLEPCISKRSIASDEFGVIYASANGLVAVGNEANGVISSQFITRDTFAQFDPATITAAVFERRYYGFYDSATYGAGCVVFARNEAAPFITLDTTATAVFVNKTNAKLYYVSKEAPTVMQEYDPLDTIPGTYRWKSKLFQSPMATNLGCFRILAQEASPSDAAYAASIADQNAAITAANASILSGLTLNSQLNSNVLNGMALNGSTMTPLIQAPAQTVGVTVYAGRAQVYAGTFEVNKTHRLPSGFRNIGWEIEVTGNREILAIDMATSPQELQNG